MKPNLETVAEALLAAIKFSHTKKPRPGSTATKYAMFDLEDTAGIMRCILWPEDFAKCGDLVVPDALVAIRGTIDKRPGSEEANLICNELIPVAALEQRYTRGIRLSVSEPKHGEAKLAALRDIHEGWSWVMIIGNGLAGGLALAAWRVGALRGRWLWVVTALAQVGERWDSRISST